MVNIGITRMSSKGQIVIPQDMRNKVSEGEKLLVIECNDNSWIIKKASKADETFQEDLEFARRTEEAYQRIEAGKFISVDSENLTEEMKKG